MMNELDEVVIFQRKKLLLISGLKWIVIAIIGCVFWIPLLFSEYPVVYFYVLVLMPLIGLVNFIKRMVQLFQNPFYLSFSAKGLRYCNYKEYIIPWNSFADANVRRGIGINRINDALCIVFSDDYMTQNYFPRKLTKHIKKNRKRRQPDLTISMRTTNHTPEQAFELLRRFKAHYD